MSDIALEITRTEFGDRFDFAVANGDLKLDEGLRTAVIVSLFTDRRVTKNEVLLGQDQRGWWADAIAEIPDDLSGSKLWLLEREKQTNETLTRAVEYAKEALQWMIDDEIAETINVVASYPLNGFLKLEIEIQKPDGDKLNYAFDKEWKTEGIR